MIDEIDRDESTVYAVLNGYDWYYAFTSEDDAACYAETMNDKCFNNQREEMGYDVDLSERHSAEVAFMAGCECGVYEVIPFDVPEFVRDYFDVVLGREDATEEMTKELEDATNDWFEDANDFHSKGETITPSALFEALEEGVTYLNSEEDD